jgi:hypothetical protein
VKFAAILAVLAIAPAALAQHAGDVWPGVTSGGKLTIDQTAFVPDLNYVTLPPGGPFFPGWADSDPGFDRVVSADPEQDIFALQPGAQIWLEVVEVDPAFRVVILGNPPLYLDDPGEAALLGDQNLHIHIPFHINSDDLQFDPELCVWKATFFLRDNGGTNYAPSDPFTFRFTNVMQEEPDGDLDNDLMVTLDDFEAFSHCLSGPSNTPEPFDPAITTCEVDCHSAFDFDLDLDLDLADFAEMQILLGAA